MALADNLSSYWKLDESSGNASDSVGSNTLTNNNSATYSTGKIGNGVNFVAASSQSLSHVDDASFTPTTMTWSFWVKVTSTPSSNTGYGLIDKRDNTSGTNGYQIQYYNNAGTPYINLQSKGGTGYNWTYNITLTTGTWYHFTFVMSNGAAPVGYVNGILVTPTSSASGSTSNFATPLYFGRRSDGSYLNGSMDEVGFWSRALTADEVSQIFNSGRANAHPFTATPSLYGGVAYYKLDESSGNATDSIGNIGTLTNNNTTTYGAAKINNGAIFNGSNQSLSSAAISPFTNAYTVNYWVNPDDSDTSNQASFSIRPASGNINVIQVEGLSTSKLRCLMYSSNGTSYKEYRTSVALTAGTWNMVTLTWDGTTWTIYTNGAADPSITKTTDNSVTLTSTSRTLRLGAESGSSNFFDGNEDEFGIWSRALSSTEVTALYNLGNGLQYPFTATSTGNFFLII
jgi:hypothetical protein